MRNFQWKINVLKRQQAKKNHLVFFHNLTEFFFMIFYFCILCDFSANCDVVSFSGPQRAYSRLTIELIK